MKYFLGIDPGSVTGAWAILDEDEKCTLAGSFHNFIEIHQILKDKTSTTFGCIEKVYSTFGMNEKAKTSFIANYGGWLAILEVLGIGAENPTPQQWQKYILGNVPKGETKKRSLKFAQKKWPTLGLKNEKSGIPDALCIALYGKRKVMPSNGGSEF